MPHDALFLDRSARVRLRVGGPDRAKFLHNVTTNDVKRLAVGRGVEAFVTSLQGKTLGFVTLLAADGAVLVRTDPGALGPVLPHFQKYGVFDDVTIDDVSASTFEFHVAGPRADEVVGSAGGLLPEPGDLTHTESAVGGVPVRLVRESPFGAPGLSLIGDQASAALVRSTLFESGAGCGLTAVEPADAEALRIEAGTPAARRDVAPENLPQEVGRDARAINFVKGCYLGQETVARIDALGHVNRHLRGLLIAGGPDDVPPPGAALEAAGKAVGVVTSAAFSARRGCPVALGYVRTAQSAAGTTLDVVVGDRRRAAAVVVVDLPMPAVGTA